jgi:lipopolysaccharide transport system ATP-binding protein
MSNAVIQAESIAKQYRIGARQQDDTLRDVLVRAASAPLRGFRSLVRRRSDGKPNNKIWALKDVSFEVKRGEVVGIIGRNGAGKSTLLKILSRITEPTKGRARINGRVGSLLEVGTGFHPELSGRENIYLNGAILGMKRTEIERKFDDIVSFAEVEKFIDTPVKHYSSGMYLRLAFAVAAHLEPEILMIDEVLAVGDMSFQSKCLGKMEAIAGEGRTVLFVSHNLPAIKSLCNRAILIDQGVIEKEGDASSVVEYYLLGKQPKGQIVWPEGERPGNHSLQLISVRLLNAEGLETSVVNISEDFTVEIYYEIVKPNAAGFSLILFDSGGACVFGSLSNTEKNFYGKPLKCSRYKSSCRLPGNLLNSGNFSFSIVGFSANWTDQFLVERVISFQAIDDGLLRGDYYGGYSGSIRPKLFWETSHCP